MVAGGGYRQLLEEVKRDPPAVAVVLGSGLGQVARRTQPCHTVSFAEIPGWPIPTVPGHSGCLGLVNWCGRRVLLFEGRLHRYEGHDWDVVERPIRLAADCGVSTFIFTNAAGGIADALTPGSLLVIRDHIDWTGPCVYARNQTGSQAPQGNPMPRGSASRGRASRAGVPRQSLGTRVTVPSPYSSRLVDLLLRTGAESGLQLTSGTYAAVTGPCYETPAEIRALKTLGADAVGMSTAREAAAARDLGMQCAAISLITNRAAGLSHNVIHHDEVLHMASRAAEQLAAVLEGVILRL